MKKFWLSLCVLLCCVGVSQAQAEYPDVPRDDPAYADINLLSQQGVMESDYDYSISNRAATRYEFAVAIARLLDSEDGAPGPITPRPAPSSLNKPGVTAALKRLAEKFLPDLKALGIEVEQIKINGVFLIEREVAPEKPQVTAESPDVPLNDSAYADINIIPQLGIIEDCYFGGSRNPKMTRYEFAVAIARLLDSQLNLRQDKDGTFKPTAPLPATSSLNKPEVMAALKRLAKKFFPEIKALGIDIEQIRINGVFLIEPKAATPKTKVPPQFSDVPKNHWAFSAVEKLRLSGIVVGYPNGSSVRSE